MLETTSLKATEGTRTTGTVFKTFNNVGQLTKITDMLKRGGKKEKERLTRNSLSGSKRSVTRGRGQSNVPGGIKVRVTSIRRPSGIQVSRVLTGEGLLVSIAWMTPFGTELGTMLRVHRPHPNTILPEEMN